MSDLLNKRINELEEEIARLSSIVENLEEQLVSLYKEKDGNTDSSLVTEYESTLTKKIKEEK